MSEPTQKRGSAAGIALLVIGLVILVPSGLCTGFFGIGAIMDIVLHHGEGGFSRSILSTALLFGVPVVGLGAMLVYFGIRQLRRK